MPLPDYADWLTSRRFRTEEAEWAKAKLYERYAASIKRLVSEHPEVTAITEFGGGSGLVPWSLDLTLPYTLIDRNRFCLHVAVIRNSSKPWVKLQHKEIRELDPTTPLVCGFAVLKHFRLPEWQDLFVRLFAGAKFGLFTVPIAAACVDDGTEFTHVRITEDFLSECLLLAGHRELWRDTTDAEEPLIATEKFE